MAFFTNVLAGALQRGQQIRDDKEAQRREITSRVFETLDQLKGKREKQKEEARAMQQAARAAVASGYVQGSEDDVVAYLYSLPEDARTTAASEISQGLRTVNIRRPANPASTANAASQTQQMLSGTQPTPAPAQATQQSPQRRESLLGSFLGGNVTDGLSQRVEEQYLAANPGMDRDQFQTLLSEPTRPQLAPGTQVEVRSTPQFTMTESMLQQMTPEQFQQYSASDPVNRARIEAELARQAGQAEEARRLAEIEARRRETPTPDIPVGLYKRAEAVLLQNAGLNSLIIPNPTTGEPEVNMNAIQANPEYQRQYREIQAQLRAWENQVRGGRGPQDALTSVMLGEQPPITQGNPASDILGESTLDPLAGVSAEAQQFVQSLPADATDNDIINAINSVANPTLQSELRALLLQ